MKALNKAKVFRFVKNLFAVFYFLVACTTVIIWRVDPISHIITCIAFALFQILAR